MCNFISFASSPVHINCLLICTQLKKAPSNINVRIVEFGGLRWDSHVTKMGGDKE
jgi:hypothetical protein